MNPIIVESLPAEGWSSEEAIPEIDKPRVVFEDEETNLRIVEVWERAEPKDGGDFFRTYLVEEEFLCLRGWLPAVPPPTFWRENWRSDNGPITL